MDYIIHIIAYTYFMVVNVEVCHRIDDYDYFVDEVNIEKARNPNVDQAYQMDD